MHRSAETYLDGLLRYGREVERAEPGDVALFKYGRVFWHGGIVTEWPTLIHAFADRRQVCWGNAEQGRLATHRPVKFISAF